MNRFLENKVIRLLLFWATLAAIVAYAWMGSKMMEPQLTLPSSIATAVVFEAGAEKPVDEAFPDHAFVLLHASKELDRFESAIRLIGGLPTAIDLVLNFDEPYRYNVTESRVEFGAKLLESKNQLAKALTKAWLFQKARADLTSSLLRMEVVSDLLWAMLNGRLDLEQSERAETDDFPKPAPWLLFARPLRTHCDSGWRSMELRQLCILQKSEAGEASDSIQANSFRPLLGGLVWEIYQGLSFMTRIDFLRAWVSWIIAGSVPQEPERPEAIGQWRVWLRSEFERLLPPHLLVKAGLTEPEQYTSIVDQALEKAGIADRRGFDVDFLFRSMEAADEDVRSLAKIISIGNEKLWKTKTVALVETSRGIFTLPGLAKLEDAEEEGVRTHQLVWESCSAPSVQEILGDQVRSQKVLYVKTCEAPLSALYSQLVSMGIQGFAASNPGVTFALLRRTSMELAASKKLFGSELTLNDLLNQSKRLADWPSQLGFREAKWNAAIQAYRVIGAVEAVEWFRAEKEKSRESN